MVVGGGHEMGETVGKHEHMVLPSVYTEASQVPVVGHCKKWL